ncbi:MAG: HesA/MoeB/ThiF family protein [Thermoplasmatales archaeon]|nr:HesA/MoeB/ThiF family protein [Thermoplasmatales archaeon]MCW6169942.1 HesA/MoeB/ThiF family protein [Thermoplasmatales archaeon]
MNFGIRYSREIALKEISIDGYIALKKSKVSVIGLGSTGSVSADLFVRAGISKIALVDGDNVDITNLHRQILYDELDVGKNKAEMAAFHLKKINSDTEIASFPVNLDAENISELLDGTDLVMDGTDNMRSRRVINEYCVKNSIPWVFTSSIGTVAEVKAIIPGKTACLSCFIRDTDEMDMSCEQLGVLASAPLIASSIAWTTAVRILKGEDVSGNLVFIDAWNLDVREISIARNPECPVCGN